MQRNKSCDYKIPHELLFNDPNPVSGTKAWVSAFVLILALCAQREEVLSAFEPWIQGLETLGAEVEAPDTVEEAMQYTENGRWPSYVLILDSGLLNHRLLQHKLHELVSSGVTMIFGGAWNAEGSTQFCKMLDLPWRPFLSSLGPMSLNPRRGPGWKSGVWPPSVPGRTLALRGVDSPSIVYEIPIALQKDEKLASVVWHPYFAGYIGFIGDLYPSEFGFEVLVAMLDGVSPHNRKRSLGDNTVV